MIVKELTNYLFDKVVLYTQNKDNPEKYIDLFKGDIRKCNQELLQMEVKSIGAKREGVLDIRIEW